jgi:hypothetical protein
VENSQVPTASSAPPNPECRHAGDSFLKSLDWVSEEEESPLVEGVAVGCQKYEIPLDEPQINDVAASLSVCMGEMFDRISKFGHFRAWLCFLAGVKGCPGSSPIEKTIFVLNMIHEMLHETLTLIQNENESHLWIHSEEHSRNYLGTICESLEAMKHYASNEGECSLDLTWEVFIVLKKIGFLGRKIKDIVKKEEGVYFHNLDYKRWIVMELGRVNELEVDTESLFHKSFLKEKPFSEIVGRIILGRVSVLLEEAEDYLNNGKKHPELVSSNNRSAVIMLYLNRSHGMMEYLEVDWRKNGVSYMLVDVVELHLKKIGDSNDRIKGIIDKADPPIPLQVDIERFLSAIDKLKQSISPRRSFLRWLLRWILGW